MADNLQPRIDAMYRSDRIWAIGFVIVLWVSLLFVLLAVREYIKEPNIEIASWIALLAVGLFNTASITAMVRHYNHDKERIYSIDIRHLDEMAKRR
jgi:hypothetical protein